MKISDKFRSKLLNEYGVLETSLQEAFDDIVEMARALTGTPIAMINFMDEKRIWARSCVGVDFKERSREESFCQTCIDNGEGLFIEDLRLDQRFKANPFVTENKVVFYAAAPIVTAEGHSLGTLCVLDYKPHILTDLQKRHLQTLASQVMGLLELALFRKNAERKKSFKNIIENLKEVVFMTDAEGKWTYLSPPWSEIFGHDVEGSLGKKFLDYVHPDDRKHYSEKFLPLLRQEEDFCRHQVRYLNAEDDPVWVEVFARLIVSPEGESLGISGTITDINDKKVEYEKFLEEKNLLDLITNNLGDVVWMSDPEKQKILYVSPSYDRVWGRDRKVLTENAQDFLVPIHPEDLQQVIAAFPKQVLGTYDEIYRLVGPDGQVKWIEDRAFPIKDQEGKVYRVVGIASDITEKVLVQRKIREQNELFEIIVNNIPIFLTVYDKSGLKWLNKSAEAFSGWTIGELKGVDIMSEFFPDPDYRKKVQDFMSSPDSSQWRTFNSRRRNGEVTPTSWMNVRLSSGDRIGIGQDISLQVQQEKVIQEQQMKIVAAAKMSSLGEMAAGVAHEINNPLTIITGNVHLLKQLNEMGAVTKEDLAKFCDKAESTIVRISKIINGLKTFARDGVHDPFAPARLSAIVKDTLSFCEARFRNNNVQLIVESFDENLSLECRYVQISQVLLNLLNNAFDAVVKQPECWVKLSARQSKKYVFIEVEDSGLGIPKEIQQKIMQPFFTTKPVGKGTGLGLSLSSGIIESHHGKLVIDDTSKHTKFVIQLPIKQKT